MIDYATASDDELREDFQEAIEALAERLDQVLPQELRDELFNLIERVTHHPCVEHTGVAFVAATPDSPEGL